MSEEKANTIASAIKQTEPSGWYVFTAMNARELRTEIPRYSEGEGHYKFEVFVPLTKVNVSTGERLDKVTTLAGHFVFLRGKLSELLDYCQNYNRKHISIYRYPLPQGGYSREPLLVPQRQMERFQAVSKVFSKNLVYEYIPIDKLEAGDVVRIPVDQFAGVDCIIPDAPEDRGKQQHVVCQIAGGLCAKITGLSLKNVEFVSFGSNSSRLYDHYKAFFSFADKALQRLHEGKQKKTDFEKAKTYLYQMQRVKPDSAIMAGKQAIERLICYAILGTEETGSAVIACREMYQKVKDIKWGARHLAYIYAVTRQAEDYATAVAALASKKDSAAEKLLSAVSKAKK